METAGRISRDHARIQRQLGSDLGRPVLDEGSWYWGATVVRTIVTGTGETFTATSMMYPSLVIPRLHYGNRVDPAHLRPNLPYNYGLLTYTDALPGDVLSDFAVEGSHPSDGPAPAWLQVNPTTGELVITPPPNENPGPFPQPQWNQRYIVAYTITRNGIMRRDGSGIGFYVDPL